MRIRVVLLTWATIAFTVFVAAAYGVPAKRHLVDFSAGSNLKVLFDAGLRPTRVPGLETRTCEIGPSDLTIRLPNGNQFDIDIQRASFAVLGDNKLGDARIFGADEEVPEAAARVKAIAAAMGLSDEGLDEITDDLGTTLDPNKRWHRSGRIDDLTVGVTFYPMFYRSGVMAQAWVQLIWRRAPGTYRFLTEPIQPPPGYEHLSMAPTPFPTPPPIETHTPSLADRVPTTLRAKSDAASPPTAARGKARASPSENTASPVPTPTLSEKEAVPGGRWAWLIAGILLTLLVAVVIAARIRSSP